MKIKKNNSSFGILDVFFIILLAVCAAGVLARYIVTDENGILAGEPEYKNAAISVLVSDIEGTSSDYFTKDDVFTILGVDGKVASDFTVTPAQYYTENSDGELVIAYHDEENGRIDCRGVLVVSGYYVDGVFAVGDGTPVTVGMYIELVSDSITVTALITDISEMS